MKLRSLLLAGGLFAAVSVLGGCAAYSWQSYGSPVRGHMISEGATRADVLASMGEPNSIYRADDTEVFVYRGIKGNNYFFGIYQRVKRDDIIVVMDQGGNVLAATPVEVGRSRTFFGAPGVGGDTHPIPQEVLTRGPDNYSYTYESGSN